MGFSKSLCYASLPCGIFIVLIGGIWACFGWSSSEGHVGHVEGSNATYWPYVSDTGANIPESCLFTLILTWGAFFTCATSYFYYRYIIHHCGKLTINTWAFVVSVVACFGATLVGAFQWTVLFTPHIIGASLTFIGAMIYSWMIVYINFKYMSKRRRRKSLLYTRVLLAMIETLAFSALCISLPFTYLHTNDFTALNVNTISEWTLIFSAILFYSTFLYEMMEIRKTSTKLTMKGEQEVSIFLPGKGFEPTTTKATEISRIHL